MGRKVVTAVAMAAMAMAAGANADARKTGDPSTGDLAQAQPAPASDLRTFDIPPQSLVTALNAFGRQAGVQISIDESIARGVQVQGVSGTMRPEQALNLLLSGTGIVARFAGERAVILTKPRAGEPGAMQLDPVQVQAYPVPPQAMIDNLPPPYVGGQVATGGQLGMLGNRPVMDAPFNQTSYTAKTARDQQARTVRDVLINDPSVRSSVPDGASGDNNVRIRGFPVPAANAAYGGLYGILPSQTIMAELAERIEVLKGPSVLLNGMPPFTALGGTINIVPKRAPAEGVTQLTTSYFTNGQFGGHVDAGRRFGADDQFGLRFNGVFRAGQTAVDNNTDQRALAIFGLDFRGERVRLSADLGYQYQYIGGLIPYIGLATGVPLPWAPDARRNIGQPWGEQYRKDLFGVVRAEVDLVENVTAYAAFGAHDNRVGFLTGGFNVTVSNVNGNGTTLPRNGSEYYSILTGEMGVRAIVDTGPIGHELALTATSFSQESGAGAVLGTAFATNIYNPSYVARLNLATPAANRVSINTLTSVALADTLTAADKRIQLTVGARLQNVQAANYNDVTGAKTSSYDESALSPAVALVFKPWSNVSVYGNFIQGLERGTIVGNTFANAGEVFPPYRSTQYEAGVKVDWGRLTTTASVFQISQPSTLTDVTTNRLVLSGEQRNQGLELNAFGEVADGVRLLGGVMFLSAVLTKTQGGLTDGWVAPFAPGASVNLGGEWDLPFARGVTLTGLAVYTSSQYIDTTFPRRSLPEWTRFDVGARYTFDNPAAKGRAIVARFNVENVFDNDYWAGGGGVTSLFVGAPRTFRLSLTADF